MTTDYDSAQPEQPDSASAGETVPAEPFEQAPPWRAMMPVSQLAAHPANVRTDLDLNEEFVASIAANGVLVPLRITPDGDSYRVIDGGRRLAAAVKAGTGEVPFDLVAERAGDEAGQYLDMITTNAHRNPLTVLEEADALFAAKQAGATRTRLRKTTGKNPAAVNAALAAARLTVETRTQATEAGEQLSLDQYAILAEFQNDPDAVERLLTVARWGSMDHEAERIRQHRAEQADHHRLRGELEDAGYQVTDTAAETDQLLATLLHDGEDLTAEAHADCPGRAVFFYRWDLQSPVHYCTDPAIYGHTSRSAAPASAPIPDGDSGDADPAIPAVEEPPDPSRRIVIEGNKAWTAATEVRRRWLTSLFARRTTARELTQFIARQLVTMPDPLWSGLARAHCQELFSQLTGHSEGEWVTICGTAPAGRLPLVMFAPVATAYESAMGEGEGRNTWRTGRYSPCPREQAAAYLTLLAGLGYQLSVIERAVADQQPYTGEAPRGQAEIGDGREPENQADGSEAEDITAGEPEAGQGDGASDEAVAELPAAEAGEDRAAA
jgi:ParB family transcriptional regulator, chromosome partitioning protein